MDSSVKEMWVKALRSGQYDQGTLYLKKEDFETKNIQYCCLGVLAEITSHEFKINDDNDGTYYLEGERVGGMSPRLASFLPISIENRLFDEKASNHIATLMTMNDDGESFNTIADYIEENL